MIRRPSRLDTSGQVAWMAAVLVLLLAASADAKTRSCQGYYRLAPASASPYVYVDDVRILPFNTEKFSALGSCGWAVPNRCRSRAQDVAHKCMAAHWDAPYGERVRDPGFYGTWRFDYGPPEECWGDLFGDRWVNNYPAWEGLYEFLSQSACDQFPDVNGTVVFRVEARTTGQKKCSRGTELGLFVYHPSAVKNPDGSCRHWNR